MSRLNSRPHQTIVEEAVVVMAEVEATEVEVVVGVAVVMDGEDV